MEFQLQVIRRRKEGIHFAGCFAIQGNSILTPKACVPGLRVSADPATVLAIGSGLSRGNCHPLTPATAVMPAQAGSQASCRWWRCGWWWGQKAAPALSLMVLKPAWAPACAGVTRGDLRRRHQAPLRLRSRKPSASEAEPGEGILRDPRRSIPLTRLAASLLGTLSREGRGL